MEDYDATYNNFMLGLLTFITTRHSRLCWKLPCIFFVMWMSICLPAYYMYYLPTYVHMYVCIYFPITIMAALFIFIGVKTLCRWWRILSKSS